MKKRRGRMSLHHGPAVWSSSPECPCGCTRLGMRRHDDPCPPPPPACRSREARRSCISCRTGAQLLGARPFHNHSRLPSSWVFLGYPWTFNFTVFRAHGCWWCPYINVCISINPYTAQSPCMPQAQLCPAGLRGNCPAFGRRLSGGCPVASSPRSCSGKMQRRRMRQIRL